MSNLFAKPRVFHLFLLAGCVVLAVSAFSLISPRRACAADCCDAWEATCQAELACATGLANCVHGWTKAYILQTHNFTRARLMYYFTQNLLRQQAWMTADLWGFQLKPVLQRLAREVDDMGMISIMTVGTFFDASAHLDVLRQHQEMRVETDVNYYPSEALCDFGTNVRTLAASEQKGQVNQHALSAWFLRRQTGPIYSPSAEDPREDLQVRFNRYKEMYCDPHDYFNTLWALGRNQIGSAETETATVQCDQPAQDGTVKRYNRDVDFSELVDLRKTLQVDYQYLEDKNNPPTWTDAPDAPPPPAIPSDYTDTDNAGNGNGVSDDEEDIIALASLLYGNDTFQRFTGRRLRPQGNIELLQEARAVMAKRQIAANSLFHMIGMKSPGGPPESFSHMRALLKEIGFPEDDEIHAYLGRNPSYYAQMEVLTKKAYQSHNFYVNLVDQPANAYRQQAALKAIELMQQRDTFQSIQRTELMLSLLLEMNVEKLQGDAVNR